MQNSYSKSNAALHKTSMIGTTGLFLATLAFVNFIFCLLFSTPFGFFHLFLVPMYACTTMQILKRNACKGKNKLKFRFNAFPVFLLKN